MNKKVFVLILCIFVLFFTLSCKKESAENIVNTSLTGSEEEKESIPSPPDVSHLEGIIVDEKKEVKSPQLMDEQISQEFEFYLNDFYISGEAQGFIIQMNYDSQLESFFNEFLSSLSNEINLNYEKIDSGVSITLNSQWDEDDLLYEIIGKIFSYSFIEEPIVKTTEEIQESSLNYSFLGFPFTLEMNDEGAVINCPLEFSDNDLNKLLKVYSEILSYNFENVSYFIEENKILMKVDKLFNNQDLNIIRNSLNSFASFEYRNLSYLGMDIPLAISKGKAYLLNPFQADETKKILEENPEILLGKWDFVTNDIIKVEYDETYSNDEFITYLKNQLDNFNSKPDEDISLEFELYLGDIKLNFTLLNNNLTIQFSEKMDEKILVQKVQELSNNLGVEIGESFYDEKKNILILPILISNYSENLFDNLIVSLYQYSNY